MVVASRDWWRKRESDGWIATSGIDTDGGATYRLFRARDTEQWFVMEF